MKGAPAPGRCYDAGVLRARWLVASLALAVSASATPQVIPLKLPSGRVLQVEGYGARAQAQIDFGEQVMWIVLRHAPIEKL